MLIIVAGLRYGIGTDYWSYISIYQLAPRVSDIFSNSSGIAYIEPGFLLLNVISKALFGSFVGVATITCVIILFNIIRACKRFQIDILLALPIYVALFYLSHNFNIIRHGIAVSFVWVAFSYVSERKFFKFLLHVLAGALFHKVALLAIPFYFFLNIRFKFWIIILVIIVCYVLGLLVNIFNNPLLTILLGDNEKFEFYVNDYYKNIGGNANFGLSIGTLLNIIWIFIIYHKWFIKAKSNNLLLANALLFGVCAVGLFNKNGVFVERISGLFYPSLIFIIPQFYLRFKKQWLILFAIMIYCLFYFVKVLSSKDRFGNYQYIPYKTVFNEHL